MTRPEPSFFFSSRTTYALAVAALLSVLPGCTTSGASTGSTSGGTSSGGANGDGPDANTAPSAYVAAGSIVDTEGKPLPNVEVVVDNQLLYDSNEIGKTGTDGRYRIELPEIATTWHVTATHSVDYHGKTYSFPLHPNDDSAFAGNTGAVRNFEWKLKGKRPDGGYYGAFVVGYTEPGDVSIDLNEVEVTLVPDGPLADGSTGETVTGKFVSTGDGMAVQDIPIGRYVISAKLGDTPLRVRLGDGGTSYETSVTSDFDAPFGALPIYRLQIDLALP